MGRDISKIFGSGALKRLFWLSYFVLTPDGFAIAKKIVRRKLISAGFIKAPMPDYNVVAQARLTNQAISKRYNDGQYLLRSQPKISIIVVGDSDFEKAKSVIVAFAIQNYSNWELWYIGDSVIARQMCALKSENYVATSLIQWVYYDVNISKVDAAITALKQASGDFVLTTTNASLPTRDCLFEMVKMLNAVPNTQVIYADSDEMDSGGDFSNPYYKPDWSPDTLLSRNYIGNALMVERALLLEVGGYRPGFDSAFIYDLALRATERATHIAHISEAMFHDTTPKAPLSVAEIDNQLSALQDATTRRGTPASVTAVGNGVFYMQYHLASIGKVSIIIPSKDQAAMLKVLIDSIIKLTEYPDYELIVLDNNSITVDFFNLMADYEQLLPGRFMCTKASFPFNFSKLINIGAAYATGEYLLLLNNDMEVTQPNWMTNLAAYAQLPHVGAVGCKLLYENGAIQHAGIALGINGDAGHLHVGESGDSSGYFNSVAGVTNYSAVTGACLMVEKEKYVAVGGMDEDLPMEFNDIDFCLKLYKAGYFNVYLPSVTLYHYESASRGHPYLSKKAWTQRQHDLRVFKTKWSVWIANDPFYNRHLSRTHTDCRIGDVAN